MIGVGNFHRNYHKRTLSSLCCLGVLLILNLLVPHSFAGQDSTGRELPKPAKKTPTPTPKPIKKQVSTASDVKPSSSKPASAKTTSAPRLTVFAPPGALIEVDGSVKGFAGIDGNLVVLGIASGEHKLSASLTGYQDWQGAFMMGTSGAKVDILMKKKPDPGKIAFTINEPGVSVIIDGQETIMPQPGQKTILSDFSTGTHQIVARKKNFREWKESISVEPGRTAAVSITLKPQIDLEMLMIEEGVFEMGNNSGDGNQRPKHQVFVSAFEISRTEIPNRLYKLFVDETGHQPPQGLGYGWHANQYPAGHDDYPVVFVTWNDAVSFCKWLSQETGHTYRLPTEAEWEKAARMKSTPESIDQAGSKFLSAGKVWEWCYDWFDPDYYKLRDRINPQGPVLGKKVKMMGFEGQTKSLRGGGFGKGQVLLRAAERNSYFPEKSRFDIGFRVVREIKQGASK